MRALTVKQPWADAIAHGPKRIENRARPIPQAHVGTTILIHAGAQADRQANSFDPGGPYGQMFLNLRSKIGQRGAIVAVATLASCHQDTGCCRPWGFPHAWHWVLEDVRPVPHPPRPVRGQLGLWTVPDDVLAAVQRKMYITERFGL